MIRRAALLAALCCGCSSSPETTATPAPVADGGEESSAIADAAPDQQLPDAPLQGPDADAPESGPGPDADQQDAPPIEGATLVVEQIGLGGSMGESALIVGPDGTSVLIDTGSQVHANTVLEAIERNTGARAVDWVVVTHFHEDHQGGFDPVFNGNNPATIRKGVITRGMVDIGADNVTSTDFGQLCAWLTDPAHAPLRFDLCSGPAQASCSGGTDGAPWAATACDGLRKGVLDDPTDDAAGKLSTIRLGSNAELVFFAADARVAAGSGVESLEAGGLNVGWGGNGPENARSVAAVLRWGSFAYVLAGDMTGEGASDNPEVEQGVAQAGPGILMEPGGAPVFPAGSVDLMHVSHHGYNSSTQQEWVDWLLPNDGQSRNALIGCNKSYLLAPMPKVLNRVGARVAGGFIWLTESGVGGSTHARLMTAKGSVVVRVSEQGGKYSVAPRDANGEGPPQAFTSTFP